MWTLSRSKREQARKKKRRRDDTGENGSLEGRSSEKGVHNWPSLEDSSLVV
jgi:hypothetical protein